MHALILDDESNIRKVLKMLLSDLDFGVLEASSVADAAELVETNVFDIAFIDLRLPDGSGMDVLKKIKETSADTIVLIVTAFATTETAIEAMKLGAYDYVTKPFNLDEIRIILKNTSEKIALQRRVIQLQQYADDYQHIIGKSEAMQRVFITIDKIAPFDTSVLIIGETGTGKELVAKALHNRSRRAAKPFMAINCASLPAELLESELFGYTKGSFTGAYTSKRGLIEDANGGSLFLDEIAEMPAPLQAKILRFLEDKRIRPIGSSSETEVDVRIIAATNKNLKELLGKGDFRDDLYYRLSTFEMRLPSLKDRREDIPLLIEHFVKVLSRKFDKRILRIDPAFIDYVMRQELKGNVRELKNIIERELILAESGFLKHTAERTEGTPAMELDEIPDHGFDLNLHLWAIEKGLLQKALDKSSGIKTKAAELLGITFREFRYRYSKIEQKSRQEIKE